MTPGKTLQKVISSATLSCLLMMSVLWSLTPAQSAWGGKDKIASAGTVLMPISPRIDPTDGSGGTPGTGTADSASGSAAGLGASRDGATTGTTVSVSSVDTTSGAGVKDSTIEVVSPLPSSTISAEQGVSSSQVGQGSVLKGTIQMTADDTEYDQDHDTFLGTGNVVVLFGGQKSKLEADVVLYDQEDETIDARGNVKIYRDGQLTTGSSFKFKVTSNEYMFTSPDTELDNVTVIARFGYGNHTGVTFKHGTMQLANIMRIANNPNFGPGTNDLADRGAHPDMFLPATPGYKFTARKMVYEKFKDGGGLTVFGGKLQFGNFDVGIPLPKFKMNISEDSSRAIFPITPMITNNLQAGGTSVGPAFNFAEGKTGVLTVAPLWQFGGNSLSGVKTRSNGPAARIDYRSTKTIAHFAYGVDTNFVVADYKHFWNKNFKFQSGINRYLEDGLFGVDRAQYRAEFVHNKTFSTPIPGVASINFRSAGGWYQDNPGLLNQSPSLAALYGGYQSPLKSKVSAFRISEQVIAQSQPIFYVGNEKYGAKMMLFGGACARGYSTGDHLLLGQVGPVFDFRLNRVNLRTGYTQSVFSGHSPFVFDQFIQGTRSVYVGGDVKVNRYLMLGGTYGYDLVNKLAYQKTICAAIGPEDFKVLLSRDMVRGLNRYGFDILFGQTAPFNKLIVKSTSDSGQLGGI